jgi:hypothetical protein
MAWVMAFLALGAAVISLAAPRANLDIDIRFLAVVAGTLE